MNRKGPVPTDVGLHWTCELPEYADVESTTYGMFTEREGKRCDAPPFDHYPLDFIAALYERRTARGRENQLNSIPLPSEPNGRTSRIRLSSWWSYLEEDWQAHPQEAGEAPVGGNGNLS